MKTARQLTYDALFAVIKNKAYSNLALDSILTESTLPHQEKNFVTAMFYGVLERQITLLHVIKGYSSKPVSKLDKEISIILQMGIYQLLYMDSVPDSAAVDEAVKLTAYARKASAKGFVNAVLRGFLRDKKEIKLPDIKKDAIEYYSIKFSCPAYMIRLWEKQYGMDIALSLCECALSRPPLAVRVNTLKTTAEKLVGYLEVRGVKATLHPALKDCLVLENTGEIDRLAQFKQGLFHVQDTASQLCVQALSPKKGDIVLDICAAPGSKSFTMAQLMENKGEIYDFDLYEHKLKLITMTAKRLGISIIHTALQDGSQHNDNIKQADCVLCDVPCSGLGILRRKPEIKLKTAQDIADLPNIQLSILKNAASYVKEGGKLVYSTCTLNFAENEEVVNQFLANGDFEGIDDWKDDILKENCENSLQFYSQFSKMENKGNFMMTLMPSKADGEFSNDGFFFAVMRRKKDLQK